MNQFHKEIPKFGKYFVNQPPTSKNALERFAITFFEWRILPAAGNK